MSSDRLSGFEKEVAAEKASSLGLAGRRMAAAVAEWQGAGGSGDAEGLLFKAADAAYAYMIQRELCGLRDHQSAFDEYLVPGAVLAKMGAIRR